MVLGDLIAELAMLGLKRRHTFFDRSQIDRRRWLGLGREHVGNCSRNVAVEERKHPLHERHGGAHGMDGALHP